jgi:precorrin-2 dehydrogenase/sirohydrochlorin ferrochelatase
MIPLIHDFTDSTVLVFGGGSVGTRKAERFAGEADVIVISPTFETESLSDVRYVRAAPSPENVDRWFDRTTPALVVAATDDEALNEAIEREAQARGVLVNRTDEAGPRDAGSVVVPATVSDGPVLAAIATSGTSPALSKHLRKELESELAGVGELATLLAELRTELRGKDVSPATRQEALRAVVASDRVWKHLDSGNVNVRNIAEDVISDVMGDSS